VSGKDITVLLNAYHLKAAEIAQRETDIAGLRHEQALLVGLMHRDGVSFRALAPLLHISKSRVHQLAESTVLRPSGRRPGS
jgi:hypothetical protein